MVWCFDVEVELGREHGARETARVVLPIPKEYVGMLGGLNQSQELGDDRGIGVGLDAFSGLQVDTRNEDGTVGGLPQKGLVPTAVTGVGLEWCESTGLVSQN